MRSLHIGSLSRAVASVRSSTFWVMRKAYQFLSSWSLNKFLLVTLGDLKVRIHSDMLPKWLPT